MPGNEIEPYYYDRFAARAGVDEDYNAEAQRMEDRERDIYDSKRSSRPAYTRPDPEGTVRIKAEQQPGYDRVTFPIMRQNAVSKMHEDDLKSPAGSLWRLQRLIADAKFDLLKQCIASAEHMVEGIECEIVVRVTARTLTNKANAVTKVKNPQVKEVSILLPNGDLHFGGY